jgi:hypothetical protein
VTPERLRAYVLIAVRDILIPMGGLFLSIFLPLADRFEYWHLPLIAGMLGVPLVARGGDPPEVEMPPIAQPASQEDS